MCKAIGLSQASASEQTWRPTDRCQRKWSYIVSLLVLTGWWISLLFRISLQMCIS